jgi:uncharacterized heparinase superfamily protein
MEERLLSKLRRNWMFARHLRPHQIVRRIQLSLLRRWRVRHPPRAESASASLRQELPRPLMPPRGGLDRTRDDRWRFTFLNQSRELEWPIDWDLHGAEARDQLWKMNLHYMEYLESATDADFCALVEDWIAKNRPYRPKYWTDIWNSYTTSLRVVVWLQQLALRRERLNQRLIAGMTSSLVEQIDFLHRHLETDLGGNHLIKNLKALLWAARCLQLPAASRWRHTAHALLRREPTEQILSDGVHYERSPSYHCQVFADLIECFQVLEDEPLKAQLGAALARMAAATADLAHPDGRVALFNDAGLSMAHAPGECLAAYRQVSGRAIQRGRYIRLESAGFFGVRTDDSYVLADCGAIAPDFLIGHGHGDILSFEWSVGGRRIIVDPGVFEYNAGPRRAYARSTMSHNTVTVDGAEQGEFFGSFRCGRRARARVIACQSTERGGMMLEGTHDGFDHLPGRPRHVRRFVLSPSAESIEILDRIEGDNRRVATTRLLLHPTCAVEIDGSRAIIRHDDTMVDVVAQQPILSEEAYWSPDMGLWLQTRRLEIRFEQAHRLILQVRPRSQLSRAGPQVV